jgi:hypothetical protein
MPEALANDAASPDGPFFQRDRAAAAEAGRKGGRRRQELARLKQEDPEAWARETFAAERAALSKTLLDAALGRGEWHELALDKRLTALSKALEYAVGRPVARKDTPVEPPEQPPGLTIE